MMRNIQIRKSVLVCVVILSMLLVTQTLIATTIAKGPSDKQNGQNGNNGNNNNDDLSEVGPLISSLENESIYDGALNDSIPLGLGKMLRLQIGELIAEHREKIKEIRAERRLFNAEIKNQTRALISMYQNLTAEFHERRAQALDELRKLRAELQSGNITVDAFRVEVGKIKVELISSFKERLKLGQKLGQLGKELSAKNREFAQEIIEVNRDFKKEFIQIINQTRSDWRNGKGHP